MDVSGLQFQKEAVEATMSFPQESGSEHIFEQVDVEPLRGDEFDVVGTTSTTNG